MKDEIPHLHVVRSSEDPPIEVAAPTAIAPPRPALLSPPPGQAAFEQAVIEADLDHPAAAFRVACAAQRLLAGALDIRHAAAAWAPSAFVRGVTPGEKTAEATKVVLDRHLAEVWTRRFQPDDLRRAALLASTEIASARRVAAGVGLDAEESCRVRFAEAEDAVRAEAPERRPLVGGDVAPSRPFRSDLLAAALGGVILGLFASWISSRVAWIPASPRPARLRGR